MRCSLLFGLAGSVLIMAFAATPQAADPFSPTAAPRGGGRKRVGGLGGRSKRHEHRRSDETEERQKAHRRPREALRYSRLTRLTVSAQ